MEKIKKKELKTMVDTIMKKNLKFYKGTISGNSIEVEENDPDSFTSFTYYEDSDSRDSDFEILTYVRRLNPYFISG